MIRTEVGRCPACGLGISVGILEIDDPEHAGGARLERFTCGHRIAGLSPVPVGEPSSFGKMLLNGELLRRARREISGTGTEIRRRAKDAVRRLKS